MAITSPYNSFVQFGQELLDCKGDPTLVALPVYGNLSIKFQFSTDELLPTNTVFKAAVCSEDCETIDNPNYEVIPLCSRFRFVSTERPLESSDFPLLVGNYSPDPGQPQIPEGTYNKDEFLQVIADLYEVEIPSLDFFTCCGDDYPTISGIVVFFNGEGSAEEINLGEYYGGGYVDYPSTDIDGLIDPGQCFRYCILDSEDEVLSCSNLFYREVTECKTTVITYWNEENAFGLRYITYQDGGDTKMTENKIRLKVNLSRPDFNVEENIYRQPSGFQQRISTIISKEWLARTSWMDQAQHERLLVALKHDYVNIYNSERGINYRMTQIGDYEIDWQEVDGPTAPAQFRINDFSQSNTNNNCGFNCGIDFVDDCQGGGGSVIVPCPEKYGVEFTGNDGVMTSGNTVYQDDNLIGKDAEVFREGLYQYSDGVSFNSTTGEFTFTPAVDINERIAIWEV